MLNIVFIASEAAPLAKTGGLADVAGSLPQALRQLGHRLTVIMPLYRHHLERAGIQPKPTGQAVEIWADGVKRISLLHEVEVAGLRFVLVEQDDLYARDGLYGPPGGAYDDNLLRFSFFNRVALEAAALAGPVDIIHCHDWQSGLVPLLLRTQYMHKPQLAEARCVFTIHNLAYQGVFPASWLSRLGLPSHYFHTEGFEFYDQINCMKAGILAADAVTTVSPSYAREILTPAYGCQLDGFLARHGSKLSGIVNGLDTVNWDPKTDSLIAKPFGAGNIAGKKACKQALQEQCGFQPAADVPLMTLISRLADQKGIDLVIADAGRWLQRGYQLAILGSGDPHSEYQLQRLAESHPQQMYFWSGFNEKLARQIYAGGDIFLMPSRFEPCGLGQLMAMRYGNVPVVRATGGLIDTVTDYAADAANATGFHFADATPDAFDAAVEQAVALYRQPRAWAKVRTNALKRDSSWDASARAYADLYTALRAQ